MRDKKPTGLLGRRNITVYCPLNKKETELFRQWIRYYWNASYSNGALFYIAEQLARKGTELPKKGMDSKSG